MVGIRLKRKRPAANAGPGLHADLMIATAIDAAPGASIRLYSKRLHRHL
jgi:hypothetical protein